jgi:hypothetical protein
MAFRFHTCLVRAGCGGAVNERCFGLVGEDVLGLVGIGRTPSEWHLRAAVQPSRLVSWGGVLLLVGIVEGCNAALQCHSDG